MTIAQVCPCLPDRRRHLEEQFRRHSNLSPEEWPRAVTLTCYAIAALATDETGLACLTRDVLGMGWAATEEFLALTASHFAQEIRVLRDHLVPEERGVGTEVPGWVLREFVQVAVGEVC